MFLWIKDNGLSVAVLYNSQVLQVLLLVATEFRLFPSMHEERCNSLQIQKLLNSVLFDFTNKFCKKEKYNKNLYVTLLNYRYPKLLCHVQGWTGNENQP